MNPFIAVGLLIVHVAIISYTVAIYKQQRHKVVNKNVLTWLTIGVSTDTIATICMMLGSTAETMFTLHGSFGYSALLMMLIDATLLYRLRRMNGEGTAVPKALHLYTRFAYIWWIIAYVTGSVLAMSN